MTEAIRIFNLFQNPSRPLPLGQAVVKRYVDTAGKNAKKIQEYIQNQLQNDLEYDQMTLKEYIDPFTGEPVNQNK